MEGSFMKEVGSSSLLISDNGSRTRTSRRDSPTFNKNNDSKNNQNTMKRKRMTSSSSSPSSSTSRNKHNHKKKRMKKVRSKYAAIWELLGGIFVYVLCVTMPCLLAVSYQWYQEIFGNQKNNDNSPQEGQQLSWIMEYYESYLLLKNPLYEQSKVLFELIWKKVTTYASMANDVQFVLHYSFLLTLVRLLILRSWVPRYLAPKRLAAMGRCKSSHLLSASNATSSISSSTNKSTSAEGERMSAFCFATAIFRGLYCSCSCTWAYVRFSRADFWPIWVGGKPGQTTKKCWDLSGSIVTIESDQLNFNHHLRYFFLLQIAYQLHSLWFHLLTLFLQAYYLDRGNHNGNRTSNKMATMRLSMVTYWKPLLGHLIFSLFLWGCFVFSGLRRLGAIGIFALEFSSAILQLLQLCIHAPSTSLWRKPQVIRVVHSYIVIPSFIYARIGIVTFLVGYSSAFESLHWLNQLDKALGGSSGIMMIFYIFFNSLLFLATVMNILYLHRLWYHPQVKKLTDIPSTSNQQ